MKVYVAERVFDYEGFEIIGIFKSYEAAQKTCDADQVKTKHNMIMDGYRIEDFELDPEGMW